MRLVTAPVVLWCWECVESGCVRVGVWVCGCVGVWVWVWVWVYVGVCVCVCVCKALSDWAERSCSRDAEGRG